jgi:hypothetical protein
MESGLMSTQPQHPAGSNARPIEKSKTSARQGVTGHNVRYVLVFGTAGIIIAFAIIYIVFFASA